MKNHCPVYTLQLQQLLQFLNYLLTPTSSIMPRTTRSRRGRRPAGETPPTCPHCGNDGHISTLCPRTSYSTSAPALTCRSCVHKVQSAKEGDAPYGILHLIIPCSDHSTTTNPPRDTSAGAAPAQDASVTDPSPPPALKTTPSDAAPPVQPSTSVSIPIGRRVNGVNPSLSLQRYHKVASLVHGGDNLYSALDSIGISRGSWRAQRLIAECQLLYTEALADRIDEDNAEKHADVLRISKDLLSMNGTREQLRGLHADNPSGVLKPLLRYD